MEPGFRLGNRIAITQIFKFDNAHERKYIRGMTSCIPSSSQTQTYQFLPLVARNNQVTIKRQRSFFVQVLVGAVALWMFSGSLQAQTIWNGSGGTGGNGTWATAGEWSAGLPGAGVTTRFQLDGTRTTAASVVDFTGAQSVGALQVGAGKSVTLEMANGSSLTANGNGNVGLNSIGTGTGPASLTLQGPGTGSATYSHIRFDVVRGSSLTLTGNVVATGTGDSSVGRETSTLGGNTMSILAGASSSLQTLAVGRGSSNNQLLVSGSGSSLTTSSSLTVGSVNTDTVTSGTLNSARATAGGQITSTLVGLIGQGVGTHSNYIEATGAGSVIQFSSGLRVGDIAEVNAGGNYLRVASSATVKLGAALDIYSYNGSSTNYGSNYVKVDAGGLLTSNNNINVRNTGLLQLAATGVIEGRTTAGVASTAAIAVASGGRFEAAGTGLGAVGTTVNTTVNSGATFAIGLGDAVAASTLTLSNTSSKLTLNTGSTMEIGIFGAAAIDQLNFTATNILTVGTDVNFKLTLHGYAPVAGNSWAVIIGSNGFANITSSNNLAAATFETPSLSPGLSWDMTQFNQADGWIVSIAGIPIPEPNAALLVGLPLGIIVLLRRMRNRA